MPRRECRVESSSSSKGAKKSGPSPSAPSSSTPNLNLSWGIGTSRTTGFSPLAMTTSSPTMPPRSAGKAGSWRREPSPFAWRNPPNGSILANLANHNPCSTPHLQRVEATNFLAKCRSMSCTGRRRLPQDRVPCRASRIPRPAPSARRSPGGAAPGSVMRKSQLSTASGAGFLHRRGFPLTWGVSGQAHSFAPAAGVSPAKRGEAQRSRERSDLDAPAAGYTVTSERALARSWLPLWSLPRSFILALRISFGVWIRSVSPSFACSLDGRITSHPVELVGARTIIPHARGRRARVGGDHPVKRRVSARQSRGHRPPGSGEAVAFGFAGMGLSC